MEILILNWKDMNHPQKGGAEIIVYELAKRLVSHGHKVTWFSRSFKNAPSRVNIDGISVIRQGNLITSYLLAPIFYWSLKRKPDLIVDCSNTILWQTPIWAWKSKKIAYVNQLAQEVFGYEYPAGLSHLGMLVERLQYLTYRNTQFLCYSRSTRRDLLSMGISNKKIRVFPLGLDHDRYRSGKKSTTPLFICVNRLVRMKRTDLVLRAMKIVCEINSRAKLVVVGTGYHKVFLQNLRDNLGLKDNVEFADENVWFLKKDHKDRKIKLMQSAWALVFPSVKEGWGMTVTECAACGTPAIVTDVTGLKDSIQNGATGLIISANPTPSELAKAITKLISNERLRQKLSRNAIRMTSQFTWDKSYSKFISLL